MIIEEQSAEQNQNDFEVKDLFIKENNNILEINKNMITEFMAPLKSAPSDIEKVIEETRKNYRKKRIVSCQHKGDRRNEYDDSDNDSAFSSSQSSISRGFSPLMSPIPSYNSNHRVYDSVQQYQNGRASNGGQLIVSERRGD
uniref:Uncharacterized protein n=1 Tax=Trichogramma kaykai TaxID=54128 RepID=A0ABD2W270_9HYME